MYVKLRPKVLALVLGILAVSIGVLTIPLYWYTRSALEDQLDKRLLAVCEITANNLNRELLYVLSGEPSMTAVRAAFEKELSRFLVDKVDGIAVYGPGGTQLAHVGFGENDDPNISLLLGAFSGVPTGPEPVVSEIYQLPGRGYLKAAARKVNTGPDSPAVLMVWGGADFMSVIDQMVGSVFWIFLASMIAAISLAMVFSRSLIRPVRQLSAYARSIQRNIHAGEVDLDRTDEFGDLNRSLVEMHTEIRENEQSTKQLLSGIAHEIKNPLGGMEIFSGLLKEELSESSRGTDTEERGLYLEKIMGELRHLKQIVTEYLDYARPLKDNLKPLQLETVFEDAYRLLLPELKQKKVRYALTGNAVILGDESKLRRVFVNLLKNSLQAVGNGGTIAVSIEDRKGIGAIVGSDDGVGIPAQDIDRVVLPHFTTQDRGYGLGLTIARNIIEEMNGTIVAESEAGNGTTFRMELPKD
ncbi:MAG: ATP-binding protein [Fidelibacterota bacterium]